MPLREDKGAAGAGMQRAPGTSRCWEATLGVRRRIARSECSQSPRKPLRAAREPGPGWEVGEDVL